MSSLLQGNRIVGFAAGATSSARAYASATTVGSLLTAVVFFQAETSAAGLAFSDTQGNVWATVVTKAGSNPSNTLIAIGWAVAGTNAADTVTASWTNPSSGAGGLAIEEWSVTGTGTVGVSSSGSAEDTAGATSHVSSSVGLNAQADDVMLAAGVTDNTLGTPGFAPGTNWTQETVMASRCGVQYRLPTGTVTGDQGAWTSTNSRPATSVMAIFRRLSAGNPWYAYAQQ